MLAFGLPGPIELVILGVMALAFIVGIVAVFIVIKQSRRHQENNPNI